MMIAGPISRERMRLLAVAMCVSLCACSQVAEELTTVRATQTSEQEENEKCAKLSEITIGMTTSQVLLSCERKPLRTSNIISGGGKQIEIWVYKGSYLHFVGDKLEQIYQ